MKKIYYEINEDLLDIDEILQICTPSSSSWFDSLPVLKQFRSIKNWMQEGLSKNISNSLPKTAKVCPGIKDLFKHTVLIKLPCDVLLETFSDGRYTWATPNSDINLNITSHPYFQYTSEKSNLFKDKLQIKFNLPVQLCGDKNLEVIFLNPYYHKSQPYEIVPGYLKISSSKKSELPLNTFFPITDKVYHFKAGEIIAYMVVCGDEPKLLPLKKHVKKFTNKVFLGDTYR